MPNDPIHYGPYNEVLTLPSMLDTSTQADIGRVLHGDLWASREVRDINPETLVRVLRNTADLEEMFAGNREGRGQEVADSIAEKLYGVESLEAYFEHLAWGDQADGPFVFERWQFMMPRAPRVSYQVEFHATAARTST